MTEFCSESQQSDCFSLQSSKCDFHLFRHCKMSVSLALFAYTLVGSSIKDICTGLGSAKWDTLWTGYRGFADIRNVAKTRKHCRKPRENQPKIARETRENGKRRQNTVVFGNNAHFTHLSNIVTRQILSGNTSVTPEIDVNLAPI